MAAATTEANTTPVIHLHDCTYTSCYCEENAYLLIKRLVQQQQQQQQQQHHHHQQQKQQHYHQQQDSQLFAIFISNASETVSNSCASQLCKHCVCRTRLYS